MSSAASTPSGRLLGNQDDAVIAAVVGELDAEAVEDAAAQRREQALVDAVVLGARHELVAFDDLQLIEPRRPAPRARPPCRRPSSRCGA